MKIQDAKDSKIFPHENTHAAAKIRSCFGWALKRIWARSLSVFPIKNARLKRSLWPIWPLPSLLFDVTDDDGVKHVFWKLDDPKLVSQIPSGFLANQQLFIADGASPLWSVLWIPLPEDGASRKNHGSEPFNYVMTYFTNIDSKDLKIFPMHLIR